MNWPAFQYKPDVRFAIAYGKREIYIKYFVHEASVKAEMTEHNQRVYEDSCVEFFFMPADDGIYYNFEFNSIGTTLLSAGKGREERVFAERQTMDKIRTTGSLGKRPFKEEIKDTTWDLTIVIPFEALFLHSIISPSGLTGRANFYKCGDKLSIPHYLSWSPVQSDKPNFHLPSSFGIIRFD